MQNHREQTSSKKGRSYLETETNQGAIVAELD